MLADLGKQKSTCHMWTGERQYQIECVVQRNAQ
jgi:hypothetical protein